MDNNRWRLLNARFGCFYFRPQFPAHRVGVEFRSATTPIWVSSNDGRELRDWRDGIHGKRIGEWASTGTKRWFVCTECHNPHDVQQGNRNRGFAQLAPEFAPQLLKGLKTADHERDHGHAAGQKAPSPH